MLGRLTETVIELVMPVITAVTTETWSRQTQMGMVLETLVILTEMEMVSHYTPASTYISHWVTL